MPSHIKFGNRSMPLPGSRLGRMTLGIVLIIGGILGFLPILGFWMIPLGIVVLSVDICAVRKARRRTVVWWLRRKRKRKAAVKQGLLPAPKRVKMSD